jgi:hypothetical protein
MFSGYGRYWNIYTSSTTEDKYVRIFLDEILQPHLKMASSSHSVVLNQIQWFILVTSKSHIPKNEMNALDD